MNKKQLIVTWAMVILVAIFLGVGSHHVEIFGTSATNPNYPLPMGYIVNVTIYGRNIGLHIPMRSDFSLYPPFHPLTKLVWFLINIDHLIIMTLLLGSLLIHILRNKKKYSPPQK